MRHLSFVLSAWGLAFPAVCAAAPGPLAMQDFLRQVTQAHPIVRTALAAERSAQARRVGAAIRLPANPVVTGGVGVRSDRSGSVPAAQGVEWSLHLEQAVEVGGQRSKRLDEVDAAVTLAHTRVQVARAEVYALARSAYIAAQLATAQVNIARQRAEQARDLLNSVEARLAAGATNALELDLARAELGRAQAAAAEDTLRARAAQYQMALLANTDPTTVWELDGNLTEPVIAADSAEALLVKARARRFDVLALQKKQDALDATLSRLGRDVVPNVTFFVDTQRQQPGQVFAGGGMGISLPVWRRNQGEEAVVHSDMDAVQDEIVVLDQEVRVQVLSGLSDTASRRDIYRHWDQEIVPAGLEHMALSIVGWKAGKWDFRAVVQSMRDSSEATRARLVALGELWNAHIALEKAVGVVGETSSH